MAKWTTTYFGPYWPSSGCLKRTGLGSYYMHCARTRGVEISTYAFFFIYKSKAICGDLYTTCARAMPIVRS